MTTPPSGTVTFVFTDIEGSTHLLQTLGARYADALDQHSRIIRTAFQSFNGYEVDTQGDAFLYAFHRANDALKATIAAQRGLLPLRFAVNAGRPTTDDGPRTADGGPQTTDDGPRTTDDGPSTDGDDATSHSPITPHTSQLTPHGSRLTDHATSLPLRVRMSIHTGEPTWANGRYVGLDLNRGARFCSAAHGGQVLVSRTTKELTENDLPAGVTLRDMGEHRLKDLRRPWRLFQVVVDDLPSEFPPLRTLDTRPNNLPTILTPLVDREADIAGVMALLRRDTVRLVTLMGPGGVGKTRLSLQVGLDLLDDFPNGVYVVNLATLTDPGLVIGLIAQTLNVREQAGKPIFDSLVEHLREKRCLLILDNFEQITLAAPKVSDLLMACARLKVLATSRAALRIRGEHEWVVSPLALPPTLDSGRRAAEDPTAYAARITQYASVELFIQRATAVKPDFQINNANAPAVAEICYRLDGLPLAIELAAARIRLMPPQTMLNRLDSRLKLLTGGARDLPERHQTLRAAIEWSHDLLDDNEKALFRRLAVFVGGSAFETAEEVAGDLGIDLLDGLESLVGESLLIQRDTPTGEPRFAMLETIREFALEQLESSGEANAVRQRHGLHFLHLAEQAEPELRGANQATWLERLDTEHDNLRAALAWLRQAGSALEELGRLVYSLARYWYIHGFFSEGREWLQAFLGAPQTVNAAAPDADRLSRLRARVAGSAGVLAWAQGDYPAARAYYEESLALYRSLGDPAGAANALSNLGLLAHEQGDYDTARVQLEESLALRRQAGDRTTIPTSLINLALILRDQGDFAGARAFLEESLSLTRALGDQWRVAVCLNNLGEVALSEGNQATARRLYDEALALRRSLGDRRGVASSLNGLARVMLDSGQTQAAIPLLQESLSTRQSLGDKRGIVECLDHFAILNHLQQQLEPAARLLGLCATLRETLNSPRPPSDRSRFDSLTHALRDQLGDAVWQTAWDAGRADDLTQAVTALLA